MSRNINGNAKHITTSQEMAIVFLFFIFLCNDRKSAISHNHVAHS